MLSLSKAPASGGIFQAIAFSVRESPISHVLAYMDILSGAVFQRLLSFSGAQEGDLIC